MYIDLIYVRGGVVVPDLPGSACSDSDVDVFLSAVLAPMQHALAELHALVMSRAGSSGQISVMCGLGVDTLARVMDVTAGAARAMRRARYTVRRSLDVSCPRRQMLVSLRCATRIRVWRQLWRMQWRGMALMLTWCRRA